MQQIYVKVKKLQYLCFCDLLIKKKNVNLTQTTKTLRLKGKIRR